MKKKISPEERLSIARNNMISGLLNLILSIMFLTSESFRVDFGILILVGTLFLLGMGVYYFITQKAYVDDYEKGKPFATPISSEAIEFTELAPKSESKKKSQETPPIFKIYNAIGIIGLIVIVLFIYLGQITSVILPIIFVVLIAITIGIALYHLSMNKIPK